MRDIPAGHQYLPDFQPATAPAAPCWQSRKLSEELRALLGRPEGDKGALGILGAPRKKEIKSSCKTLVRRTGFTSSPAHGTAHFLGSNLHSG